MVKEDYNPFSETLVAILCYCNGRESNYSGSNPLVAIAMIWQILFSVLFLLVFIGIYISLIC